MKSSRILFVLLVMVTCALMGCAPNSVSNPTPLANFDQQARSMPKQQYIIGPGDILDVKFLYNPEFNEVAVPVRPDGYISLQIVNEQQAAGLTVKQFREALVEKYSSELKKPEIAVIVRNFNAYKIYIDGEVIYPGPVDLKGPTTLMQALSLARGLRETARLSNIIVIRKDSQGKSMSAEVDYRKIIDGSDLSQDILLIPYDIVYVPKSNIANVNKFVNEYINNLIPSRFPEFSSFYNPYTFAFGGKTEFLSQ